MLQPKHGPLAQLSGGTAGPDTGCLRIKSCKNIRKITLGHMRSRSAVPGGRGSECAPQVCTQLLEACRMGDRKMGIHAHGQPVSAPSPLINSEKSPAVDIVAHAALPPSGMVDGGWWNPQPSDFHQAQKVVLNYYTILVDGGRTYKRIARGTEKRKRTRQGEKSPPWLLTAE